MSSAELPRGRQVRVAKSHKKSVKTPKTPSKSKKSDNDTPLPLTGKDLKKSMKKFVAKLTPGRQADPPSAATPPSVLPTAGAEFCDLVHQEPGGGRPAAVRETIFIRDDMDLPIDGAAGTRQLLDLAQIVSKTSNSNILICSFSYLSHRSLLSDRAFSLLKPL